METGLIEFGESNGLNGVILTKDSSYEQIKDYFRVILKLHQEGEAFPIDLDDVWQLVYSQRSKAVSSLKRNFLLDEDYISFSQMVEREIGGSTKVVYKLSVACLEYFVARKERRVFDVYREVFHRTFEIGGMLGVEMKLKVANWAGEFLNLNDSSRLMMARSILEPLGLPVPDYVVSNGIHHSAKELLAKNNIPMSSQAFNKLACANGYLDRKTRKSRHGDKSFYIISEKGKQYGENLVSDKNPNETQPHWYDSRFKELLNKIGIVC